MKASVTRKINEITKLMCAVENVDKLIAAEKVLDGAKERFRHAHENYHQVSTTLEDQQSSV